MAISIHDLDCSNFMFPYSLLGKTNLKNMVVAPDGTVTFIIEEEIDLPFTDLPGVCSFDVCGGYLGHCDVDEACCEGYAFPDFHPEAIYRSGDYTTVEWTDGSKTTVKKEPGRHEDPYAAFLWAFAKRLYGSTTAVIEMVDAADEQLRAEARRIEKEKEKQERIRQHEERLEELRRTKQQELQERRAKILESLKPDEIELRAQERAAELLIEQRAMGILQDTLGKIDEEEEREGDAE